MHMPELLLSLLLLFDSFYLEYSRFSIIKIPVIINPTKQDSGGSPPTPSDVQVREKFDKVLAIVNLEVVYDTYLNNIYEIIRPMRE